MLYLSILTELLQRKGNVTITADEIAGRVFAFANISPDEVYSFEIDIYSEQPRWILQKFNEPDPTYILMDDFCAYLQGKNERIK